ncbi:hypothetical protein HAHE_11960 [Haloferula helveola]|uniref:Uncharacterized protein n=1 Tax=Haloferula helveola TaxID=490095 RepID=A0ABM7R8E1_9BACT|nr:hypothetical protein HAHE_11960 [Haloferula helveola]
MHIAITQADGFALAMLAMLAVSFGCVLILLMAIFRGGKRGDPEVEKLIDEVSDEPKKPEKAGAPEAPKREPWERDSDWWQKE